MPRSPASAPCLLGVPLAETPAMRKFIGLCLVLSAMATVASAADPVPEIDPGSIVSAMTLLTGGLLVFTDRRRSK